MKEFLSQKGVNYREHDVSRDRAALEDMVKKTGQMGVPVTVIDGETVIGFDRARLEEILSRQPPAPKAPPPSFGASVADAGKITLKQGKGIVLGAYVGAVKPGSLAERIGLKPDDIITEITKQAIANAADMEAALSRMETGSFVTVGFLRAGQKLTAEGLL